MPMSISSKGVVAVARTGFRMREVCLKLEGGVVILSVTRGGFYFRPTPFFRARPSKIKAEGAACFSIINYYGAHPRADLIRSLLPLLI